MQLTRRVPSAFAENRTTIPKNGCIDILGNGGNSAITDEQGDITSLIYVNGHQLNDSISAVRLESSDYNFCDEGV
jgi:hypothetical protein